MRLNSFLIRAIEGIDLVEVSGLSDVVVLAGPNGVGKTRVVRKLIDFFRNPTPDPNVRLSVEATFDLELRAWGKRILDTTVVADSEKLRSTLQRNQKRNRYQSTVLNFDSDRAITQIRPFSFSWDFPDPHEEDVGWDFSYSFLRDRFEDVQHSLFRLVESQRRKISQEAVTLMKKGEKLMALDFPDPIEPYRQAFAQLLAPKRLLELNVRNQQIMYESEGRPLPLSTLSSG